MRKSTFHALAFSILVGLPTASLAGSEDIVIEDAWARASIGTNRPGVAYMTLRNTTRARSRHLTAYTKILRIPNLEARL